ncbi:probable serine/threonine-protein kinase nek3 [Topomyia yanbarensis]|uniref:probable serine/threonine-protein kinase nek3 n=1 Tax=Topomyia yanbarensis TaxID=2498891 RepID=UPI00273AE0D7|nr:probable serine/threonine-protein kinase nek3 [Topomyia yanbarensis]
MLKSAILIILAVVSINCIPIEVSTGKSVLDRPSPINPEVVSDPKPKETSESPLGWPRSTILHGESNVAQTPTTGTKLISELGQSKPITSPEPKAKRQTDQLSTAFVKPALKRDQQTTSTTNSPKRLSTTTTEPVSLKTPIVHASGSKSKRSADDTTQTTSTTQQASTRAPIISSSNDDNDNSGPHFIRPVPVEQILKNIHEGARTHPPSPTVLHHDENKTEATTVTGETTENNNHHNIYHKASTKKQESAEDEKEDENDDSSEEKKIH